jgi:hypothetical protein
MNCIHPLTVVYSRSMVIDRCVQCRGYLVWCINPAHGIERHWHFAETSTDAARLASGPFDRPYGANAYGIARPLTADYLGADHD